MTPETYHTEEEREFRIKVWKENLVPYNQNEYGADERGLERNSGRSAELTELGQKLLGLRPWQI